MRRYFIRITTIAVLALVCGSTAHAQQTIVFFRHGEKPSAGLGQLTCQGLNRALALPDVLIGKFGKPDYDSLYIVRVDYSGSSINARFERDREFLNGLPTTCP